MKITFVGQENFPVLGIYGHQRQGRVQALAESLSDSGHTVTAIFSAAKHKRALNRYKGIRLISRRLPLFYFLRHLWRKQPDAVHMHGWKFAGLVWLAALISPLTTFVWTIDDLPNHISVLKWFILLQAKYVCDVITTPQRSLQYLLLHDYGIAATYIPDGYAPAPIPLILPRTLGLRKNQYVVALTDSPEHIRWLAKAYRHFKTRKPLVVLTPSSTEVSGRLLKNYPFIRVIQQHGERLERSLIQQAAFVIVADTGHTPTDRLLAAMDAGKLVIAPPYPLYEEVLGVSAQFIELGDSQELIHMLEVFMRLLHTRVVNLRAMLRAHNHFTWERVVPDYLTAYRCRVAEPVALDSIVPIAR